MKQNDFSDWIRVGGQVLDLASGIAGLFGTANTDQTYDLGDAVFYCDMNGRYLVGNRTASDLSLNMVQNSLVGTLASTTFDAITLPSGTATDITDLMVKYESGGNFIIEPTTPASENNPQVLSAIGFAIRAVAVGATIGIIGGVTGSFGKDPATGNWNFTIKSTGPTINLGSTVKVTGANNMSATATVKKTQSDDQNSVVATFPPAIMLAPTVQNLEINLVYEGSAEAGSTREFIAMSDIPAFRKFVKKPAMEMA